MDMTIRSCTPSERMYTYSQSQQISMQTGHIGYLRGDMDTNGKGFFTSWNDFRTNLKTPEFKSEFDDVINALRFDVNFDGVLKNRSALMHYCYQHPDSEFEGGYCKEYAFRVDTEKYSYLLRLNPNKGDYNLYCYCFVQEWLNSHLKNAERGIRFIAPNYKELFRIPDGDKIRILMPVGDHADRTCRYIDETHLEVSNNLFHICEFAERMEDNGNTVIPLRSSLPEQCYSILPSDGSIITLTRGVKGYHPMGIVTSGQSNREAADNANKVAGVTPAQEAAMLSGSMFGWATPAADPKSYEADGKPIAPKHKDRGDAR